MTRLGSGALLDSLSGHAEHVSELSPRKATLVQFAERCGLRVPPVVRAVVDERVRLVDGVGVGVEGVGECVEVVGEVAKDVGCGHVSTVALTPLSVNTFLDNRALFWAIAERGFRILHLSHREVETTIDHMEAAAA